MHRIFDSFGSHINAHSKQGLLSILYMYFGNLCRRLLIFHTHMHTHAYTHTPTFLIQNFRSALHLAAYRGHLPVLQYLCPMFGDRVLDKDGNDETCLDIARRLGRESIVQYLTQNYPQLEGKVGLKQRLTQ